MYRSLLHYFKVVKQSNGSSIESASADEANASLNARKEFDRRFKTCAWRPKTRLDCPSTSESVDASSVSYNKSNDEEAKIQHLHVQGDWLQLKQVCISPRHHWRSLLDGWNDDMLRFYCNALQCKLPDPSNLKRWKMSNSSTCLLCQSPNCTAQHILSSCRVALEQGRYSYRHDKVLSIIREAINLALAKTKKIHKAQGSNVRYVRADLQDIANVNAPFFNEWFAKAPDWTVLIDSHYNHYIFPSEIIATHLRPDLLVYSKSLKKVLMVELTVPWEMNIPDQHLHKETKYAELLSKLRELEYESQLFAVEVGARGLVAKSLRTFLCWLGLSKKSINSYLSRVSKTAVETSNIIWTHRNLRWDMKR